MNNKQATLKECERLNDLYGNEGFVPFNIDKVKKYLKLEEVEQLKDEQSRSE